MGDATQVVYLPAMKQSTAKEVTVTMVKGNNKWQMVEEKLDELRRLVEQNWDKGEWQLAILGESTIRTVEQSKMVVKTLKTKTGELDQQLQAIQELSL